MATTQQSGFAPAASPLASTIVQTPDDAIVAGFTSIPSQGITCLLTMPDQSKAMAHCQWSL